MPKKIKTQWGNYTILGKDETLGLSHLTARINAQGKIHVKRHLTGEQGYITLSRNDTWLLFEEE